MKRIFKWLITSVIILIVAAIISLLVRFIGEYCFPLLIVIGIVCLLYIGYDMSK